MMLVSDDDKSARKMFFKKTSHCLQWHSSFAEQSAGWRQGKAHPERKRGRVLAAGTARPPARSPCCSWLLAAPSVQRACFAALFFQRRILWLLGTSTARGKAMKMSNPIATFLPKPSEHRAPTGALHLHQHRLQAPLRCGDVSPASVQSYSEPQAVSSSNAPVLKAYLVNIRFHIVSFTISHSCPKAKKKSPDVTLHF